MKPNAAESKVFKKILKGGGFMKKILFITVVSFFISLFQIVPSEAGKPQYVGTKGCKECHKQETAEWEKSKHSKAFKRLLPPEGKKQTKKKKRLVKKLNKKLKDSEKLDHKKDYSEDKKCLPCHVVGYGEAGGFKDKKSTPELMGVGCEMCHGPGSEYAKLHKEKEMTFTRKEAKAAGAVYGSEDDKVCKKCHENPDSPMRKDVDEKYTFNWKEFLSLEKTYHKVYPLKGKH